MRGRGGHYSDIIEDKADNQTHKNAESGASILRQCHGLYRLRYQRKN